MLFENATKIKWTSFSETQFRMCFLYCDEVLFYNHQNYTHWWVMKRQNPTIRTATAMLPWLCGRYRCDMNVTMKMRCLRERCCRVRCQRVVVCDVWQSSACVNESAPRNLSSLVCALRLRRPPTSCVAYAATVVVSSCARPREVQRQSPQIGRKKAGVPSAPNDCNDIRSAVKPFFIFPPDQWACLNVVTMHNRKLSTTGLPLQSSVNVAVV